MFKIVCYLSENLFLNAFLDNLPKIVTALVYQTYLIKHHLIRIWSISCNFLIQICFTNRFFNIEC